jgi:DNA-binding NarL/FixJ family response regulator
MQPLGGIEVLAEASNFREGLRFAKTHRADVSLIDIIIQQLNGLGATARPATISPRHGQSSFRKGAHYSRRIAAPVPIQTQSGQW